MEELINEIISKMKGLTAGSAVELLGKQGDSILDTVLASKMCPLSKEQVGAIKKAMVDKFGGQSFTFDQILDFVDKAKDAKNPISVFLPECVNEDGELDLTSLGLVIAKEVANGKD